MVEERSGKVAGDDSCDLFLQSYVIGIVNCDTRHRRKGEDTRYDVGHVRKVVDRVTARVEMYLDEAGETDVKVLPNLEIVVCPFSVNVDEFLMKEVVDADLSQPNQDNPFNLEEGNIQTLMIYFSPTNTTDGVVRYETSELDMNMGQPGTDRYKHPEGRPSFQAALNRVI
ncbi:hypothetical protein BDZ45DRAFT_800730 [Acephala macrosclerotiorum]|nr:hypothetical protein BDZ45DRAFT_800730 [Acephala macrosclerotiorum]